MGDQEFGESFRVARSESLFVPAGGRVTRMLRLARRLRRALIGPGFRTVAIGRLWRYYVSLAVPVALWRTTRPVDAQLWHGVFEHYRLTRAQLDAIADASWTKVVAVASEHEDHAHHQGHEDHTEQDDQVGAGHEREPKPDPEQPVVAPPVLAEWLAEARSEAVAREQTITNQLAEELRGLERGLLRGLAQAWQDFLDSVELAGTLELPGWRTLPSTRYDPAQAAIAELLERSGSDREAAAGRLDALLARAHAEHVATVIHRAALEFEHDFSTALAELDGDFEQFGPDPAESEPSPVESEHSPAEATTAAIEPSELEPALDRMGEHVQQLRRRLAALAQIEPSELRLALAVTPQQLAPSSELGPIDTAPDPRRTVIRLQAWLTQTMAADFQAARISADEELREGLDALRQALTHLRRVVEYHHAEGQREGELGLPERIAALLGDTRAQVRELGRLASQHVEDTIQAAERAGLEPVRTARWGELRRRLRRLDEGPRAAVVDWVRERIGILQDRVRTYARKVADELTALFADRHTEGAIAAWHRALFGPRSSMPDSYQRLFTSVAAETVGLLISRPEQHELELAADRWLDGRGNAILLYGDRGVGKRTLVRQLTGTLGDRVDLRWLRLTPMLERESDVAGELATWLGVRVNDIAGNFASLQQQVQASSATVLRRTIQRIDDGQIDGDRPGRQLIVVENAERLFRRTPEGVARVRRFLDLIAATNDQVLWLVLMAEPAVTVLDAVVELRARFPTALRVPPMTATQLAAVLDSRHRLSGYGLAIQVGVPTLSEWLREPMRERLWRSREDVAHVRLAQLSGGNARQALRLWLTAVDISPRDAALVEPGPLPGHVTPLLDDLPLSSRVLLAALLVHGPLPRSDLVGLHGPHALDIDVELARLAHLGLVAFEDNEIVTIETRLVQPLTAELRACNLL